MTFTQGLVIGIFIGSTIMYFSFLISEKIRKD